MQKSRCNHVFLKFYAEKSSRRRAFLKRLKTAPEKYIKITLDFFEYICYNNRR